MPPGQLRAQPISTASQHLPKRTLELRPLHVTPRPCKKKKRRFPPKFHPTFAPLSALRRGLVLCSLGSQRFCDELSALYLTVNSRWPRTASHKTPNLAAVVDDHPVSASALAVLVTPDRNDNWHGGPHCLRSAFSTTMLVHWSRSTGGRRPVVHTPPIRN